MYDYKLWVIGGLGTPVPACGSDSVGYIDKRLNQANRFKVIKDRATMLNTNLGKGFIGYSIYNSCLFIPFN